MAWSAPMTAVVNEVWTSAQWNTFVRDNFNETAPGKATTGGRWIVSDGEHSLEERVCDSDVVTAEETTSSTSYTDLSTNGPEVTVATGANALVWINCEIGNSTAEARSQVSVAVSGSSSVSADDAWSLRMEGHSANQDSRYGTLHKFTDLTAGSNTFTMKYKVGSGTGNFLRRELIVAAM